MNNMNDEMTRESFETCYSLALRFGHGWTYAFQTQAEAWDAWNGDDTAWNQAVWDANNGNPCIQAPMRSHVTGSGSLGWVVGHTGRAYLTALPELSSYYCEGGRSAGPASAQVDLTPASGNLPGIAHVRDPKAIVLLASAVCNDDDGSTESREMARRSRAWVVLLDAIRAVVGDAEADRIRRTLRTRGNAHMTAGLTQKRRGNRND